MKIEIGSTYTYGTHEVTAVDFIKDVYGSVMVEIEWQAEANGTATENSLLKMLGKNSKTKGDLQTHTVYPAQLAPLE